MDVHELTHSIGNMVALAALVWYSTDKWRQPRNGLLGALG